MHFKCSVNWTTLEAKSKSSFQPERLSAEFDIIHAAGLDIIHAATPAGKEELHE